MGRVTYFFLTAMFKFAIAQGQITIKGHIADENNENISLASVVLKDTSGLTIIAYTFTDDQGKYLLKIKKSGDYILVFNAMGFTTQSSSISIQNEEAIERNAVLKEERTTLNEVVIRVEQPILIKKDTVTVKTKYFTDGSEQTVEELLKKIPGLQVSEDGTIKVGNREIEKLMVEGDDFFEKGYKIMSKNMPAYPIEEVEILKSYSNNRLLKNIEESDKVALNLKLNEKSKRIWFGNITSGYGGNSFYEFKGNLMNFGKKNKYYFFTNLNNVGQEAQRDIQTLIRPYKNNQEESVGGNQKAMNVLQFSTTNLNFSQNRTRFNNAELVSANAIFNPTEKLKLKTLGFFNWDEINFFRNSKRDVNTGSTSFTNSENYKLRNKHKTAFGKVDMEYNISKTQILEATTKYSDNQSTGRSYLVFNEVETVENVNSKNQFFDQTITYTNKVSSQKAFLLAGRFIQEKTPQEYHIDRFFYQELFSDAEDINNVEQQSTNKMYFAGINAHLFNRKKSGNLLEFKLGNEYRQDKLKTVFYLKENTTISQIPPGFQNNTIYKTNNAYFKTKYRYEFNNLALTARLGVHHLFNHLENNDITRTQSIAFMNPSISFDWEINSKNKISSTYLFNTTNAKVLDVYNEYLLTGYRTFSKGTGDFNQLASSSLTTNYIIGNWNNNFFANVFVVYQKNHDFFSTNTVVKQNYTQTEKIQIKNRMLFSAGTQTDIYFKPISSNLKLNLSFATSNYKNKVDYSSLREVTTQNYNFGAELRSGFRGFFNYHLGSQWSINNIKTTTDNNYLNNTSFLDFSIDLNKLNIQIQTERYFYGNFKSENTYYFLDLQTQHQLIEDKLMLKFSGNNLLNTKKIKNISISDIEISTTEYRLLPRYFLLKLEYRF